MKKIIISILFVLGITSMASAEVGVKVGLSGMVGLFETSGFENEDDEKNIAKAEESIAGMGSVFIEKTLGFLPGPLGRLSLGYDHVVTDVKTESKTRTDNDLIGIVLLNSALPGVCPRAGGHLEYIHGLHVLRNLRDQET